jgi:hypothetical protein
MMDPDMIFTFYGKWLSKLSKKSSLWFHITKPLGRCVICNTTWIGMISAFIIFPMHGLFIYYIFATGICSAGMVIIITNLFEFLQYSR